MSANLDKLKQKGGQTSRQMDQKIQNGVHN